MENTPLQYDSEETISGVDGFGIQEARYLRKLLSRFMKEYGKKPVGQSDEEWLKLRFMAEIPELSEEEAAVLSNETVTAVHEYDNNLSSLHQARAKGKTAEEWFAEKSMEAASGLPVIQFGKELSKLDAALKDANTEMFYTVVTKDYRTSQALNLDGFIAEQQHVNTFNLAAKASDSLYRAEVCKPMEGHTYGKNSFDVVIKDQQNRIVHQYQFKYGADADATIAMIKRGNYNNQTLVVPPEQVEAVQAAFPGKTVVSQIGGTEKVPIASQPLSKAEAKALQEDTQKNNEFPEVDWSAYDSRMLAKHIGKRAAFAGLQGAAIATGFHLAAKLVVDEPIDAEEVVTTALKTGADSGIKSAVAGAVKVASERGILKIIPKKTSMGTIANIVCVAIENIKILTRVANGEITMREALDLMGCNTVAMSFGLKWGAAGMGVGAFALGWIPFVGPVVGSFVGGVVGYMAGSKVGETIFTAAKKLVEVARETVTNVWEKGNELVSNGINRVQERIFSWI